MVIAEANRVRPKALTLYATSLGVETGNHQAPGSCFVGNASANDVCFWT